MTREETQKILAVIAATYPNFNPGNKTEAVNAWQFGLEEFEYKDVSLALKTFIVTSNSAFYPSVSQIIGIIHKMKEKSYAEEQEAWDIVYKAICRSGYNALEEFEKLPELIKKAVGSPNQLKEWAMDTNFNSSVVSTVFKKHYNNLVEKDKEFQKLPQDMKVAIEQNKNMMLEDFNGK